MVTSSVTLGRANTEQELEIGESKEIMKVRAASAYARPNHDPND
jgi:hypothetical protein